MEDVPLGIVVDAGLGIEEEEEEVELLWTLAMPSTWGEVSAAPRGGLAVDDEDG